MQPPGGLLDLSSTCVRRPRAATGTRSISICSSDSSNGGSTRISPDDLADMVRELRDEGLAESTIVIVVGVTNRVYRYASRRLGWAGANPVSLMLSSERPKPSQSQRRRVRGARAGADDRSRGRADENPVHRRCTHRCPAV